MGGPCSIFFRQTLIEKQKAKGVDALITKLQASANRDAEKARAKGREDRAEAINDRVDAVLCLIQSLPETDRTVPALIRLIDRYRKDPDLADRVAEFTRALKKAI